MTIAVNDSFKTKDGWKRRGIFFNLTCWDVYLCKRLEKLNKGDLILAEGDIEPGKYDKNGSTIYITNFVVKELTSMAVHEATRKDGIPDEKDYQPDDLPDFLQDEKPKSTGSKANIADDIFNDIDFN